MASFLKSLNPIVINLDEQKVEKDLVKSTQESLSIQESSFIEIQTKTIHVQGMEGSTKISQNAIWGPLLWRILHILAEQVGKPKHKITQTDEVQKWIQWMRSVEHTMPCALCRGHYKEWLAKHPLNELSSLRGLAFREGARQYVWQLHENVNTSRNISSGISLDKCAYLYGSCEPLQETVDKFGKYIQEQISSGRFKGEGFTEFRKQLTLLRKLADCI
jgi:hypothetical protein